MRPSAGGVKDSLASEDELVRDAHLLVDGDRASVARQQGCSGVMGRRGNQSVVHGSAGNPELGRQAE
jgi:hypothetical protein